MKANTDKNMAAYSARHFTVISVSKKANEMSKSTLQYTWVLSLWLAESDLCSCFSPRRYCLGFSFSFRPLNCRVVNDLF